MKNSVVLVTGTSSGIGVEIAIGAARLGAIVVATMRDLGKSETLRGAARDAGVELDIRRLDVTDSASIDECLAGVIADHGRLDALVNNAGAGHVGTMELEPLDEVRTVMEVNFFGVVAVSRAAMPLLRASAAEPGASPARLVTVSSVGGVVGQPFNEAYCAAKFAVEGFMESLAPVAESVGVRVSLVEPGAVRSEFVANIGLDLPAMLAAAGPYAPAMQAYADRTIAQFASSNAQTPSEAAIVVLDVLGAENPPVRVQTSEWAKAFSGTKLADLDGSSIQALTRPWVGLG